MRMILRAVARFALDRKAATAVEYGLILALIVLAIMAALIALGSQTTTMWNNVSDKVSKASGN